jgi:hypothetical protein
MKILLLSFFFFFLSSALYAQYNWSWDQKKHIRHDVDSIRNAEGHVSEIVTFRKKNIGLFTGVHQGRSTDIEVGVYRNTVQVYGVWGSSLSYINTLNNGIHSIALSGFIGAVAGVGMTLKANTVDLRNYSYSIQPSAGFNLIWFNISYSPNINIDAFKTPGLNRHAISARFYLDLLTKKGGRIDHF